VSRLAASATGKEYWFESKEKETKVAMVAILPWAKLSTRVDR